MLGLERAPTVREQRRDEEQGLRVPIQDPHECRRAKREAYVARQQHDQRDRDEHNEAGDDCRRHELEDGVGRRAAVDGVVSNEHV